MKKIKTYKNHVIAETNEKERSEEGKNNYEIYTSEEWNFGNGCRYPDYDAGSIKEAEDFIKFK
jgi:hypothetical protein